MPKNVCVLYNTVDKKRHVTISFCEEKWKHIIPIKCDIDYIFIQHFVDDEHALGFTLKPSRVVNSDGVSIHSCFKQGGL